MAISGYLPTDNLIESAAALLASHSSVTGRNTDQTKLQRAMACRLEQLQAALGEPAAPASPPSKSETTTPAVDSGRPAGSGKLWLAGLVSAMVGAGLTAWLTAQLAPLVEQRPVAPEISAAAPVTPILAAPGATPLPASQPAINEPQEIAELLEAWRAAWATRDAASYLSFYSSEFSPADGGSREQWAAARRKKLAPGPQITLDIQKLHIERIDDRKFVATFRQDYAAGNYRETGTAKTLLVIREGENWRIAGERQQ